MSYEYYAKELAKEHIEKNLYKISHLFDGKDIITETLRNNDNLRYRICSEKVSESVARIINFFAPMSLSFKHTQAIGA